MFRRLFTLALMGVLTLAPGAALAQEGQPPPAEQPPAEQPPAEQPPAEQPPAEPPPAEQPPAEPPPTTEGGEEAPQPPQGMTLPPKERAEALAAEGKELANVQSWAEAASKFQESILVFAITDNFYNLAYCYEQMGEWKGCVEFYTKYIEGYRADHNGADPSDLRSVQRSIGKCQETAQPPVEITTSPPGAQVAVGDRNTILGTTPFTKKLEPGTYQIFVTKEGFDTVETQIIVQPRQESRFHFDMVRTTNIGKVQILVNVREATIYIDGKNFGISPYMDTPDLEVGRHQIVITKDRYNSINSTFEVQKNQTTTLAYELFLVDAAPSWRSYLGWASVSIGIVGIAGGVVAFRFAEDEFNDTDDFDQLVLLQNIGYGVGGGLLGLGTVLLIWEVFSDAVDEDDLIQEQPSGAGRAPPFGFGVTPLDGGVYLNGSVRF